MMHNSQHLGMGARIGIGFIVVLTLMVTLSAIGLRYVAEANQRLKDIARNNNVKIELATEMHSALRERALSMHTLPILSDPLDKDEEIQRFNTQGKIYIQARDQLEAMPLSPRESDVLTEIRVMTREALPEVQAVIDMATFSDEQTVLFERIRNVAMPRQRAIANQVSRGTVDAPCKFGVGTRHAAIDDRRNNASTCRTRLIGCDRTRLGSGV